MWVNVIFQILARDVNPRVEKLKIRMPGAEKRKREGTRDVDRTRRALAQIERH